MMAATLMVVAPIIVLFFFAQKHFIQGIVFTGVKGYPMVLNASDSSDPDDKPGFDTGKNLRLRILLWSAADLFP